MEYDIRDIRVRYAETDRMGVVYNAHFLVYFEIGRTEYLRGLGTAYRDLEQTGVLLPVVEAHCHYLGAAEYDDVLTMISWVSRLRPTRIDFRHFIRRKRDGAPVAEGHVVLACVDEKRRPRRLPAEIRDAVTVSQPPAPSR